MALNMTEIIYIIEKIENKITYHKQYLTDLDAAIGDGDHGINISRGFKNVVEKLKANNYKDWGEIFKTVGMTLVSTVGGASGPLYGTAFIKAAVIGKDKTEITMEDFREVLKASIDGIKMRGKAEKGEKTMLDSLIPAYEEIAYGISNKLSVKNTLKNAVDAGNKGLENTKLIVATKGRASYLGDRSLGHQDPGATSAIIMLEVIYDVVRELRG